MIMKENNIKIYSKCMKIRTLLLHESIGETDFHAMKHANFRINSESIYSLKEKYDNFKKF